MTMQVPLTSTLSRRLKSSRLDAKITRAEVAKKLNISLTAVSNGERGTNVPSLENLIELSRIYKKSVDWLLGIDDSPKKGTFQYSVTYTPQDLPT